MAEAPGRVSRISPYRQYKAEPAVSSPRVNCGTWAERAAEENAERGSFLLAEKIIATVGCEPCTERPARTFEEQLARVLAGQARVVVKIPLTPRGYERSLIGSSAEMVAEG